MLITYVFISTASQIYKVQILSLRTQALTVSYQERRPQQHKHKTKAS